MPSFYSSLPFTAREILMMSHNDVIIICSILLAGKPLHMHIGTAMVHLRICRHPCRNPLLLQKLQTSSSLFNPFYVPVTLFPRYFGAPSYQSLNLLTFIQHRHKQG